MKTNKLLTIFTLVMFVLFAACEKDDFIETIGICPLVVATNPENGDTNVPLSQVITVTFNEEMNPATITTNSITVEAGGEVAGTVTYSGVTATFTPAAPLEIGTTYTGRVKTSVKDLDGNALQQEYVWAFSTGATVSPIVTATDPENNEVDVVMDKIITATFSQQMDPLTIDGTSFILMDGTTAIAGVVTYNNVTATFTPSANLDPTTEYTATITTAATNTTEMPLENDYVWSFTTGNIISPTVISTDPEDEEIDVELNKIITATFSEPMDALTITAASFTLQAGTVPVTGAITYSGSTASFDPTINLLPNTVYTATITTDATNISGIPIVNDYIWEFTTGTILAPLVISTDPEDNEIDVELNKTITATFNQPMDPATIDGSTFTLQQGSNSIAGNITYNGVIASFDPAADLLPNTLYTATITTGAANLAGISLANDYEWEFTTLDTPFNPTIDLGAVEPFGIISGVAVSNNAGPSEVHNLDIGVYPGFRSSITGFFDVDGGPGLIFNGDFYAADDAVPVPAMLLQAKNDLTSAYLAAEGASSPAPSTVSGDIGGLTLAPGIYKSTSTLMIQNGNLTLDGQGDPNAEWIFQIASDFTTVGGAPYPSPAGGNIILIGGAQANNITWQVGSSAVIGDYTSFNGNILALTSVTMNGFSQAVGRMLCSNGAVTLTSTNMIYRP